ncbi:MAG: 50S ribosomal protein L23 [Gammaproteobacteria bacterium]|nr:50S ribosomal protein L23 [Gammaproteobacteria bacterium]
MSSVANQERLMQVIIGPHISEKSTAAAEASNHVVFRVRRDATKPEIRAAVEQLFEVKVDDVSVVNVRGKTKRFGQRRGKQSSWKKAYVRLAAGQDLDFIGSE